MKSRLYFTVIGLVLATTILGFATVHHLPAFKSHEATAPVRVAESTATSAPRRVDCFIGMKGEQGSLYRGWVCVPEHAPALAH